MCVSVLLGACIVLFKTSENVFLIAPHIGMFFYYLGYLKIMNLWYSCGVRVDSHVVVFCCCFLAVVKNLEAIVFGPGTVRVTWEDIDIEPMDLTEYNYIVYFSSTSGRERSITVPSNISFIVISNLTVKDVYQFAVAVSRQVGMENYTGERSSPETIRVLKAFGSRAMDNGGK